jgi:serine protease inhibitor ecotin
MNLTVEIPDELASQLRAAGGDLSRRVLEGFAIEEYQAERLPEPISPSAASPGCMLKLK